MKKTYLLVIVAALFAAFSCTKVEVTALFRDDFTGRAEQQGYSLNDCTLNKSNYHLLFASFLLRKLTL